jgi:tetratricopeptide (TPR) repeat protein
MLAQKVLKFSDALYNKGLMKAGVSDLSGAVALLSKSVSLSKKNTKARNLLGLCHYETGHLGDALLQWRLSLRHQPQDNPAEGYLAQLTKTPKQYERQADAVNMFNQAHDYLKHESDDMAIIQLKKAVELNPKFVDAQNLLALCYLMQEEKDKALATLDKVFAVDVNNSAALRLYGMAAPGQRPKLDTKPQKKAQSAPAPAALPRYSEPKHQGAAFPIAGIFAFIIGAICGFAVLYILIMPSAIAEKDMVIEGLTSKYDQDTSSLRQSLTDSGSKLDEAQVALSENELRISSLQSQVLSMEKMRKVADAELRMANGELEEALDIASKIDTFDLPPESVEQVASIVGTIKPILLQRHYDAGVKSFNASRFEEAKIELETARGYITDDSSLADDVYFYLGRAAHRLNDYESARIYYQTVLDAYPDSNQTANANTRINQLPKPTE